MTQAPAPALRPLGVGDIVDRVITMYRARPVLFLVLSALPYLALSVVAGALALAFSGPIAAIARSSATGTFNFAPDVIAALVTFGVAIVVVAIVVFSVQSASLVVGFSARYLGGDVAIGDALRRGLRASLGLIGAGFLVFLLVFLVPTLIVAVAALSQVGLLLAVSIVVAFFAFFYLIASWLLVPIVITLERRGPVAGLQRSWQLSNGSRWRILGLFVLLLILQSVLNVLFSFVFLGSFVADPVIRAVLQQAANLVATVVWAPVQWGTFTVLYYDLRIRREAFDLQLAAEALPRDA